MRVCATQTIDLVGKQLAVIIKDLSSRNQSYIVDYTYPSRRTFLLDEDTMYVLRQHIDDEGKGTLQLIVGAKMAKEG